MTSENKNNLLSVKMSQSVINRYKPAQVKWHYEHGLVMQSIYAVGKKYGFTNFLAWLKIMYDTKVNEDGSISTYKKDEYNEERVYYYVQKMRTDDLDKYQPSTVTNDYPTLEQIISEDNNLKYI